MFRFLFQLRGWSIAVLMATMLAAMAAYWEVRRGENKLTLAVLTLPLPLLAFSFTAYMRRRAVDSPIGSTRPPAQAEGDDRAPKQTTPPDNKQADKTSDAAVEFCVLLETLEDIGRLISMNLDLDTLVPAIISTAKTSLKCGYCSLYTWNASNKELTNALPDADAVPHRFVPTAKDGIGAWVIRERRVWTRECGVPPAERKDTSPSCTPLPDAVAPLTAGRELLGLLVINDAADLSQNLKQMLSTLANIYGLGIRNALLFRRVEEMAQRDGLTGLYHHASFHQQLDSMVTAAIDQQASLSVVMSDIDDFKKFNDQFGHQSGDDVLRELARLWKAILPPSAVLARYGGEEFIAALPGLPEEAATELSEFLRSSIEAYPFCSNGHALSVTSSFGVAGLVPHMQSVDDLVRAADRCLYESKHRGRNQVTRYRDFREVNFGRPRRESLLS